MPTTVNPVSERIAQFEQLTQGQGKGRAADVVRALVDGGSGALTAGAGSTASLPKRELLEEQGFPPDIADAFERSADEIQSVIMSRVPGKAVLELVRHGHDLKSYQIKAKSCDWGPMSGFLCQLGPFNKKGWPNAAFNDEKFALYFEFFRDKRAKEPGFKKAVDEGLTPFLSLKLCDAQKKTALKNITLAETHGDDIWGVATDKPGDDATTCMEFLVRKDGTDNHGEPLWTVHHGRVFVKTEGAKGTWASYLDEHISHVTGAPEDYVVQDRTKDDAAKTTVGQLLASWASTGLPGLVAGAAVSPIEAPSSIVSFLDDGLGRSGVADVGKAHAFYPVNVAQNPFPPYKDPDQLYKNAVTGDYDLFAVWPKLPRIGPSDLVRLADLQVEFTTRQAGLDAAKTSEKSSAPAREDSFFLDVKTKPFALELRASPQVFVEVIPGYQEIGRWEDPEAGNICAAVATAAQSLNSFTFAHMLKAFGGSEPKPEAAQKVKDEHAALRAKFSYPNEAFHSDEGGRPGIDEIDFPVAVFLPESVAAELRDLKPHPLQGDTASDSDRVLVLGKGEYARFLRLCVALRHRTYVLFNHIWLTRLFGLFQQPTKEQLDETDAKGEPSDNAKMFKAIQEERTTLGTELDTIAQLLTALFVAGQLRLDYPSPAPAGWGVASRPPDTSEAPAAAASMTALAKAFMDAVAPVGAQTKHDVLKKAMITVPERPYVQPRREE